MALPPILTAISQRALTHNLRSTGLENAIARSITSYYFFIDYYKGKTHCIII